MKYDPHANAYGDKPVNLLDAISKNETPEPGKFGDHLSVSDARRVKRSIGECQSIDLITPIPHNDSCNQNETPMGFGLGF